MKTITEMFAELNAQGQPCAYHDNDGDQWLVTGIAQHRDSGLLARVNFKSAIKVLERAGIDHDVKRANHWAVGWVEDLVIRAGDDKAIAEIERIRAALANYPVLDDDAYSAAECAQEEEDWQNFGARELRRALTKRFPEWRDALDRMDEDALWTLYHATAEAIGVEVTIHDTEGANFRIDRVVRAMSREEILTSAGWLGSNRINRIDDRKERDKVAGRICEAFAIAHDVEHPWDMGIQWMDHSVDYADDDGPFVVADWNDERFKVLGDALESIGCMCDWDDSCAACSECGRHVETEPSHHGWQPKFRIEGGGYVCCECWEDEDEDVAL